MSGSLDLSLDDLIKNKKKRGREEEGERGSSGSKRRSTKRSANRLAPHSISKSNPRASEHDEVAARLPSAIETGTKLYISNLDYGVTNEDIKELFSEVGDLKRSTIHYDRSGRSKGTAEVVFTRKDDALAAVKRYNNVQLDGKPIKIEFISATLFTPAMSTQSMNGLSENTAKSSGRSTLEESSPTLLYKGDRVSIFQIIHHSIPIQISTAADSTFYSNRLASRRSVIICVFKENALSSSADSLYEICPF